MGKAVKGPSIIIYRNIPFTKIQGFLQSTDDSSSNSKLIHCSDTFDPELVCDNERSLLSNAQRR